jgi:phosphoribosylformimino-5-aminoimidazole carboxamide ribotide isomerase
MEIIPVVDISRGVAVHAQGGARASYEPVRSAVAPDGADDPLTLVRAYRERLDVEACYVADLDAIQGGPVQRGIIRELAAFQTGFSGELLVDAAANGPDGALELVSCGASDVVVGLETLVSFANLAAVVRLVGNNRVVFSLDLQLGRPILRPSMLDALGPVPDPLSLASRAVDAGVTALLVLDLGRVGTGRGADLALLSALRRRHPDARLLAGGGVRTREDLDRMDEAGCDGALVASAIHAGRVTSEDVAALRHAPGLTRQSRVSASRYVADWP